MLFVKSDGTNDRIFHNTYNGSTWGTATTIDNAGQNSDWPDICARASGGWAFAVWRQHNGTDWKAYARKYTGTWGTISQIDDQTNGTYLENARPRIAFDNSGAAVAAFLQYHSTNTKVMAYGCQYNGSTWQTATPLSTAANYASNPCVAMDGTGKAMVLFVENSNLYSVAYNGGWGATQDVDIGAGTNILAPEVAHISSNTYMAVYSQSDGGQSIFASKHNGTSWGAPVEIDANAGAAYVPQIAFNSSGEGTAVFKENNRIYVNQFDGTNWGTAVLNDANTNTATTAHVAYSSDENPIAVFCQSDGTNDRIFASVGYIHKVFDYGNATTSWNTAANWRPDELPTTTDTVVFDGAVSAANCVLDVSSTISRLMFTSTPGGLDFGANTLSVTGDADFTGCGTITPSTGTLQLTGTSAQTLTPPSTQTLPTVKQNGTGTTTIATNMLMANGLWVASGSLNGSAVSLDIDGDVTIDAGGSLTAPAVFTVQGSWTNSGTFTHSSGTLTFDATTLGHSIDNGTDYFYNLSIDGASGGWSVSATDLYVANNLSINQGTLTGPTGTLYVGGNWTSSVGVFTHNSGTVEFNATSGPHTITSGGQTFNNVTFAGSGGNWILGDAFYATGAVS
ncbi:MAG: hypothetical protein GF418_02140, partial [Chitinivibrionales bacterium]|nr:hypothetical protein [Chitinivibrionales bacterium]MBD3394401.1 hypothetical protein [Chitinivibrionales bacterium]